MSALHVRRLAPLQVERIANTEPVSIAVPGISDATKAASQQARQLTVCQEVLCCLLGL